MRRLVNPLIISAALLTGCASHKQSADISPSYDQATVIRESIKKNNPTAEIGFITETLADTSLAMVSDINTSNLKLRDVVSILDASETIICHGHIEQIDAANNKIVISYDAGARPPSKGDVVVRF